MTPDSPPTADGNGELPAHTSRVSPRQEVSRGEKRAYSAHGLHALKRAVKHLGGRVIDRRTTLVGRRVSITASFITRIGQRRETTAV